MLCTLLLHAPTHQADLPQMYCVRWGTGDSNQAQGPIIGLGETRRQRKKKASRWLNGRGYGIKIWNAENAEGDVLSAAPPYQNDLPSMHRQTRWKDNHPEAP